jgi:hypothetical protein
VDDSSTPTYDNFTVEYIHFEGAGGVDSSLPPSMSTPVPEPQTTSAPHSPATTSAATRSSPPPPQPVAMHSSSDGHPSGHVHSDTSSCRELSWSGARTPGTVGPVTCATTLNVRSARYPVVERENKDSFLLRVQIGIVSIISS